MDTHINVRFKNNSIIDALAVFAKAKINISNGQEDPWENELLEYFCVNEEIGSLEFIDEERQWDELDYVCDWGTVLAPFLENGNIVCTGGYYGEYGLAIKDGIAYQIDFVQVYGQKYEHRIDEDGNYKFNVGENVKCYGKEV